MSTTPTSVADLLGVTGRLISLLEHETRSLRAMRPAEAQSLQQDKAALAAAFESALHALDAAPEDDRFQEPAQRNELRAATRHLGEALEANERALRAARDASDRVIGQMVSEIERQRGRTSAYSAQGASASLAGAKGAAGLSVTLDQRL